MKSTNDKQSNAGMDQSGYTRRGFLIASGFAAAAITVAPAGILGRQGDPAPSDRPNIAGIGVGGKGEGDMKVLSEIANIYALCDVDAEYAGKTFDAYSEAKIYTDYRRMLESEPAIDAVVIATPDHTHAVIAALAMKMGKHVFLQKPLTHKIWEARQLAHIARETGVVTQMGNQGHAGEGGRLINEWVSEGALGAVREVHCWTNRPIWPQGEDLTRPAEIPSVPSTLDWNLWIGPSDFRPYHPAYAPFTWRGWRDFGTGAIGDMGAHIIDHPYWALELEYPETVHASSTPYSEESFPRASIVRYTFPARGANPPVELTWYDGGLLPPRPAGLEDGRRLGGKGGGMLIIGDEGTLMASVYGENPRLIPESFMQEYGPPKKRLPRSPGIHEEWINAIRGEGETTSHFGYAGPLTETMLLGNVAIRFQEENIPLEYDGEKMRIVNHPPADEWIQHQGYRYGWKL